MGECASVCDGCDGCDRVPAAAPRQQLRHMLRLGDATCNNLRNYLVQICCGSRACPPHAADQKNYLAMLPALYALAGVRARTC